MFICDLDDFKVSLVVLNNLVEKESKGTCMFLQIA
jgi:hypothetical protein